PDVHPLAAGAPVRAPGHHRPVAGLPARARHRRLPPVDLLRPALRPSHVALGRPQDPVRDDRHAGRQGPRAAVVGHPAQQVPGARMTVSSTLPAAVAAPADFLDRLRALAFSGLPRMYRPETKRFMFRLRRTPGGVVSEGTSYRYT